MFLTTSERTNENLTARAKNAAQELGIPYVDRNKETLVSMQERLQDNCIVMGKTRMELYHFKKDSIREVPFFFHPNSANFRVKRLIRGESDPLIEVMELEAGMKVLDCTLGLASDSIVMSFAAGEDGKITGLEGNPYVAYIVASGLHSWKSGIPELDAAMKRIEVISSSHLEYLKSCEDGSFDIVYLDPMFEESIKESEGINALRDWAVYTELSDEVVEEAKRVAAKKVILKEHFRSPLFNKYGFRQIIRKSSKFHFGVLDK
ncbi:class I SAM-dependent methyltransferase [Falsibacillus pallidus]|uniref:class I SAM-dependent methyltransferase n=1 Tax=Falsibacillus pallidus TaxID=493781 RepID=UPI003D97BDE8